MEKVLIIRFSSFGDIIQGLGVLGPLSKERSDLEIHWLTKKEFSYLISSRREVSKVWSFNKKDGLIGLVRLALELRKQEFNLIYDAHVNIRTLILKIILLSFSCPELIKRSKDRWKRILLFNFRLNRFPFPFKGMESYYLPLKDKLNLKSELSPIGWKRKAAPSKWSGNLERRVLLVPSAAWKMKRWPIGHFKKLIDLLSDYRFYILGGPEDFFCQQFEEYAPKRVINLAGKLNLQQSCDLVSESPLIISGDTGLIHVADIAGVKGISLIGPTAFGYCSNPNIETLEVQLRCKPCSKDGSGQCSQEVYQKCMVDISPEEVAKKVKSIYPLQC